MADFTTTLLELNKRELTQTIPIPLAQTVNPSDVIRGALANGQLEINQFPADVAPHRFVITQGVIKSGTIISGTGSAGFTGSLNPTNILTFSGSPYVFNKAHVLPLPTVIQDSKQVQYNQNFNWAKALGRAAGALAGSGNLKPITGLLGAGAELLEGAGYAVNTYKAVTITQPEFGTFNLEFRLFPKTLAESQAIQKIITRIQTGMHPELKGGYGASVFAFPDVFMCYFSTGQTGLDGAKYLYRFKPAVIAGMTVNYQGDAAAPVFYKNNEGQAIPEGVVIRMGLIELEVWTRQNYDTSVDASTGLYNNNPLSALNVPVA